jgi:membrane AbrB-like protein
MFFPAALVSVWMVLLSVFLGFSLARMSGIPLSTALIGAATGGVNEMAVFALSMNYDAATITIISVTRLVVVLVLTPWLAEKWTARLARGSLGKTRPRIAPAAAGARKSVTPAGICALAILSVAGGFLFERLKIPAGFMLGSMFFAGAYFLASDAGIEMPDLAVHAVQIGLGIAIAERFGSEQLAYLSNPRFAASLFACTALSLAATLILAFLLQKTTKLDPLTCLLSTSAGGLSQMILVSEEMKADSLTVSVLHLARYLVIVYCMPVIIKLILP